MEKEPLKIKRKSDDGHRIISVRIREDIFANLDRLAAETNRSRNELINLLLEAAIDLVEIEEA